MNAIILAFNRMTLLEYLNVTNDIIKQKVLPEKIKVNLCVCHVMKIISEDVKNHMDYETRQCLLYKLLDHCLISSI